MSAAAPSATAVPSRTKPSSASESASRVRASRRRTSSPRQRTRRLMACAPPARKFPLPSEVSLESGSAMKTTNAQSAGSPHESDAVERAAQGKAARAQTPRSAHAEWQPRDSRDPVELLGEEDETRVAELLPIRYGRMLRSPFAYFRGSAAVMAA